MPNLHITFGLEEAIDAFIEPDKNTIIGIDLGIKTLATLSTSIKYKNINKSAKVKLLKQRHRRLSGSISRKYESNKAGNKYVKTKNILKLEQKRRLPDRKLTNIRNNYLHYITKNIVKLRPYKVVVETLNIKGMMKNKRLSKSIKECKFYESQRQLEYKLPKYLGITLTKAALFYPSSKLCSVCRYKYSNKDYNKPWSLGIRKWTCIKCDTVHDRDINASLNLANYSM